MIRKILSLLFLFTFFLSSFNTSVHAQGLQDWSSCLDDAGVPTLSCTEIVTGNLLTISSGFIVLIIFVMFVFGSFNYLTSGGSEEKIKKARATMMYAVLGAGLFVSAFLIIKTIDVLFLGGQGKLFHFSIGISGSNPTPTVPYVPFQYGGANP